MISNETQKSPFFTLRREGVICLFLVLTTLAVYWQVGNHEFVNYDDDQYVTENQHVQAGLTSESIAWAFTSTHASNWHPLTWLSHMLDCQIYGLNPGGHHFTNVFFHILNSILLFLVFKRMTGAFWKSAFVATLFAIHPLHVESVAWVAERKDVLSTFFWMMTMGSYIWHVERPGTNRYLLVFLFFALGLMAKPMLITLPFVLLLLDYWPLGRFQVRKPEAAQRSEVKPQEDTKSKKRKSRKRSAKSAVQAKKTTGFNYQWSLALPLVREKIPLFVLAAASSIVTFFVQQSGGAVRSLDVLPLTIRISNALVSYISYIVKMILPHNLAVLYPHPKDFPMWQVAGACLLLVFISSIAVKTLRRHPYFAVGWLWYLGTLVPVIGLVQVGLQSMADRYTYIPLAGIFIIIAWGVSDLIAGWRYKKIGLFITTIAVVSILMICTWLQVGYWRSSITLFEHAIDVTKNNSVAHNNLGNALKDHGKLSEAIGHYYEALRINPDYVLAHNNLGAALKDHGKLSEAIGHYYEALRINPDYAFAHYNLGNVFVRQGRISEAIMHYYEALRINSDYALAHNNLGNALAIQGKLAETIKHYTEALHIDPMYADAHYNLGNAFVRQGRIADAIKHYTETLHIDPMYADAHNNLGNVFADQGRLTASIKHYKEALRINPDFTEARVNIKKVSAFLNEIDEAVKRLQELLEVNPGDPELHYNLGTLYYKKGEFDKAIFQYQKSLSIQPDNPASYYNLACMYSIQGRVEKSIDFLKRAIEKGYDNWDLIKSDKDLENIRSSPYYKELIGGQGMTE